MNMETFYWVFKTERNANNVIDKDQSKLDHKIK